MTKTMTLEDIRSALDIQESWEGATVAVELSEAGRKEVGAAPPRGAVSFQLGSIIVGDDMLLDHQVRSLRKVP